MIKVATAASSHVFVLAGRVAQRAEHRLLAKFLRNNARELGQDTGRLAHPNRLHHVQQLAPLLQSVGRVVAAAHDDLSRPGGDRAAHARESDGQLEREQGVYTVVSAIAAQFVRRLV